MNKIKKHAYLILAHNELNMLKLLIKSLDDVSNDIYVHIDAKTKSFYSDEFEKLTRFSELIFVKRMKVYWAGFSSVKAIILLMREANSKKQYEYYHLISGVDIPLMTQNEIHNFINSVDNDKEFVNISSTSMQELNKKVKKSNIGLIRKFLYLFRYESSKYGILYFFNQKNFGFARKGFWGKLISIVERINIALQQLSGIENNKNLPIYYGSSWYSISHNLVTYILINETWIVKHFKYCGCSDEIFLQTLIKKNKLSENLSINGNMRYIDWKRGSPYTFRIKDYEELINSNCFFARKFSTSVDKEIIKKLYYRLLPHEVVDSILG